MHKYLDFPSFGSFVSFMSEEVQVLCPVFSAICLRRALAVSNYKHKLYRLLFFPRVHISHYP